MKTESITQYQVTIENDFIPTGTYVRIETYTRLEQQNKELIEENEKLKLIKVDEKGFWIKTT